MNKIHHRSLIAFGLAGIGILSLGVVPPEELEATKPQLEVTQSGNNLIINWIAHPEVFYFMEGTPDLMLGTWTTAKLLKDIDASGTLTLGAAISGTKGFYRLSLEGDPDSARMREDSDGDKIINLLEVEADMDAFVAEDPTDSDSDGIPDYFEQFHFSTLDYDGTYVAIAGGLTLSEAYTHATDPNKVDSDGDGWTDAQEKKWGWDPKYDQSRDDPKYGPDGYFDNDELTNAEEVAIGTNPTKSDTDNDGVKDHVDGWALDDGLTPPRLPEANYVVIDTGKTGYNILEMNNRGDLLLGSGNTQGVWKMGQYTILPDKPNGAAGHPIDYINWESINDLGTVVGIRHHQETGHLLSEFSSELYTIEEGATTPVLARIPYFGTSTSAGWFDSYEDYAEWTTPNIDSSGGIYACLLGLNTDDTNTQVYEYSIGPVYADGSSSTSASAVTELGGYETSYPAPSDTIDEIIGVNDNGILIGKNWNTNNDTVIVEGSSNPLLSTATGSGTTSNKGYSISDGTSPYILGESDGDLAIWTKVSGAWTKIYDPAVNDSSGIDYTGVSPENSVMNSHAEMVGSFQQDGITGPLVRNGRVVEADDITEDYIISNLQRINENGMLAGHGRAVGEDPSADRPLLLLKMDLDIHRTGTVSRGRAKDADGNDIYDPVEGFVYEYSLPAEIPEAQQQDPTRCPILINNDNDDLDSIFSGSGIVSPYPTDNDDDVLHLKDPGESSANPKIFDDDDVVLVTLRKFDGVDAGKIRLTTSKNEDVRFFKYEEAQYTLDELDMAHLEVDLSNPGTTSPLKDIPNEDVSFYVEGINENSDLTASMIFEDADDNELARQEVHLQIIKPKLIELSAQVAGQLPEYEERDQYGQLIKGGARNAISRLIQGANVVRRDRDWLDEDADVMVAVTFRLKQYYGRDTDPAHLNWNIVYNTSDFSARTERAAIKQHMDLFNGGAGLDFYLVDNIIGPNNNTSIVGYAGLNSERMLVDLEAGYNESQTYNTLAHEWLHAYAGDNLSNTNDDNHICIDRHLMGGSGCSVLEGSDVRESEKFFFEMFSVDE